MNSYNYSYNVLINRLEAFAAGHLLIKRFTHGQIDLADMDQDEQYPFMHVVPNNIKPVDGGMQFDFQIIFADIPRDKEVKAEYQREVISDCVRLAQDLISEVKNGLVLFGFDVQLVTPPVIEPFMEEYKNTLTGVTFSLQLEVPWDWSACDIPAVWAVGGSSSGGSGSPIGIVLRTNGVDNAVQNILDLVAGTNITITDNGDGSVTFDASGGGGGGGGPYVSTEFNANHATALGNQYVIGDRVWYNGSVYACIANNDGINPTNPTYWTLQAVGYRLRQTPVDWNATSGDYQILNKPTIPSPQGLQDVITTDNVLTTDNTIDCDTFGLTIDETSNLTVNSTSKVDINVNSDASLGIDSASVSIQKVTGATQTQVIVDTTKAAISASASGAETSLTLSPTSAKLITPAVDAGTATVGQVLGLSNAATGEVEFITAGDMLKSVYDTDDDGIVDFAEALKTEVRNSTGATLRKGYIVYLSGSTGNLPNAVLAQANSDATSAQTFGVVYADIANNSDGFIVTIGQINTLDTRTVATFPFTADTLVDGDVVYLSPTTPGWITNVKPLAPQHVVYVGMVVRTSPTNGTIQYRIQNGYELYELHDVAVLGAANNDYLYRDTTVTPPLWKSRQLTASHITDSTTVGRNLITLPNPSAVRYLRINADNTVAALTLAELKTDLSLGSDITLVVAANVVNVGTTFEDVTGLSFAVTAGKTYKWRATISFGVVSGTYMFSSNGPATTINNARFTITTGATTNGVSNQVTYDAGTNVTGTSNGLATADGIVKVSASGTWTVRFRCSIAGNLTVRAGSVLEYSEVL